MSKQFSLAEKNPILATQWHPNKNGSLTPYDVSEFSHSKVWWLLPYDDPNTGKHFDFEWQMDVASRSSGAGCPFLSGKRVWKGYNDLSTTNPSLAAQWHPTKNGDVAPTDVTSGSGKKVWWRLPYDDPKTGKHFDFEWQATIAQRSSGNECPYISGKKVWKGFNDLGTTNPDLAAQWHPKKNDSLTPYDVTQNSNANVWWLMPYDDPKTGKHFEFEWQSSVANRNLGEGCPFLVGKKVWRGFNDLASTNPELIEQWHPAKNGGLTPFSITAGSGQKIWWILRYDDPETGKHFDFEWDATPQNRLHGEKCPFLSGKRVWEGFNDLYTTNPSVASEWCYEKNGSLSPRMISKGSSKEVWWICEHGHVYRRSIKDRAVFGYGCTICNSKEIREGENDLATTNPELMAEWDYEKNTGIFPKDVSFGIERKVWWKCSNGHEYQSPIRAKVNGAKCPYCSGNKVLYGFNDLETTCPAISEEWDYEKNGELTPKNVTKGLADKVWWRCKHGHSYQATIYHRTRGTGCPVCAGKIIIPGINDISITKPELLNYWDYSKNGDKTPIEYGRSSREKVWWKCDKGHSYLCSINNKSNGRGCPYCCGKKVLYGFNDLETFYPDLSKEWLYEKNYPITPRDITKGSNKKVWWKCYYGHEYQAAISNRVIGTDCPYCSGSKTERIIYRFLEENNIEYEAEKRFETDLTVKTYPFDVYCPKERIIIEADGQQHFEPSKNGYFEQNSTLEDRIEHDNLKNRFCLKNGIKILRIPYVFDPDTNKNEIIDLIGTFLSTLIVPEKILNFYRQYEFSNYYEIATLLNGY